MTFETRIRQAISPAAGMRRPAPLLALALLYAFAGLTCLAFGVIASFEAPSYQVGELVLPPAAARVFLIGFGAGLGFVAWGFHRLLASAWTVFVCAAWVGIVLELIWLAAGLSRGAGGLFYLPHLAIDSALLLYVYRQRHLFIF